MLKEIAVETAQRLREEHEQMRRLLRVLAHEVAALEPGEKVDPGLMYDVLRYLIEYPGRYHHPIENLALWRLVQRGRVARPLADQLDLEHRSMRHYGGQLLRLLEGARGDILVPSPWIAMAAHQYASAVRAHMAHEEQALLPLVEQQFTQGDWEEIARASMPAEDSRHSEDVDSQFRRLYASIAERANADA